MKGAHTGRSGVRQKQRWLIAALLVVTAFIATPSLASADSGTGTPTLSTDQLSYSPGGVVDLSGTGFAAGDSVTVNLADSVTGATYGSAAAVVSSDGTFAGVLITLPSSFMSTLAATATDSTTGDTATAPVAESMSPPSFTPAISTDQQDYSPGSVVTITGSGWPAGDTVSVFTDDSDNHSWSSTDQVTTDASGDFTDKVTLPQMFVANYKVAASDASGLTATTTFTDSNPQAVTVAAPTSVTVTQGGTANFGNATVRVGGNTNTCTITLSASPLPAGAAAVFGTNPLTMTTTDVSSTVKVTTTSSTPAGTYTFTVIAGRGNNCQGNGDLTSNTLTLVVNSACTTPSVTTQPSDQSITYGANASFNSTASGSPAPTVQWQVDNGTGFTNLSGATSATLSLTKPAVSQSGNKYHAVFTNACGSATSNGATLTVAKKDLAVTGVTASNKVYDGNSSATINTSSASLIGVAPGDAVTLNTGGATGAFLTKDVGTGKEVDISGLTISGADAGNYSLAQPTATANITPRPVTASITAANKVYDGGTTAQITSCSLETAADDHGVVGTDKVGCDASNGQFDSANADTGKTVTADVTLNGDDKANYQLTSNQASTTANITPRPVTASITAANKVYDGGTTAQITSCSLETAADDHGVVGTDKVGCDASNGQFDSANADTGKTVTADVTLNGDDKANYQLTSNQASTTANIRQARLDIYATSDSKPYDGGTSSSKKPTLGANQVQGTDTVDGLIQAFASKNVLGSGGSEIDVTAWMIHDGNGGANYDVHLHSAAGTITPVPLDINAATDSKTYDGTKTSAGMPTLGPGQLQVGDSVTGRTQEFQSKNVLGTNGSTLQVKAYTVNDGNSGNNYTVATHTAMGTIIARSITVTAVTDNKVYDATKSSNKTPQVTTGTIAYGDTGNFSQAFDTKAVGTGKTLTPSGSVTDGNSGNNYAYTFANNTTGVITPANLTVTGITANNKVWDGTPAATLNTGGASLVGVLGSPLDNVVLNTGAATGAFSSSGVGTWTVNITGLTLGGSDGGNYTLTMPTTTASITAWNAAGKGFYAPVGIANTIFTAAPGVPPTLFNTAYVWNTVKGGQTVPLKFNVFAGSTEKTGTDAFTNIATAFQAAKMTNCTNAADTDPVDYTIVATGSTMLRYDTTGGQWIYNWQTPKVPQTTCYRTYVTFADGSSLEAFFQLNK